MPLAARPSALKTPLHYCDSHDEAYQDRERDNLRVGYLVRLFLKQDKRLASVIKQSLPTRGKLMPVSST
jgi:hypothetical protein